MTLAERCPDCIAALPKFDPYKQRAQDSINLLDNAHEDCKTTYLRQAARYLSHDYSMKAATTDFPGSDIAHQQFWLSATPRRVDTFFAPLMRLYRLTGDAQIRLNIAKTVDDVESAFADVSEARVELAKFNISLAELRDAVKLVGEMRNKKKRRASILMRLRAGKEKSIEPGPSPSRSQRPMPPRNSPTPSLASEVPFVDNDLDTPQGTQPPNSPAPGSPSRIKLGDDEAAQYNEDERAEIRAFLDLLDASHSVLAPVPGVVRRYDRSQFRFIPVPSAPSTTEHDGSQDRHSETHGEGFNELTQTEPWRILNGPRTNGNELIVPYADIAGLADAHSDSVGLERPLMDSSCPTISSTIETRATSPIAVSSEPSSLASSRDSFEQPMFETTTGLPSYRAHILDEGLRRQRSRLDSTASSLSSMSSHSESGADPQYPGFPHTSSQETLIREPVHGE
ncbi:hypothetical protein B0A48_15846 [Cryoendolithus antarcticus]|uniref:Uncharacterized protein n=1 Tax=Cryoendolithus antarcticus TaxID=1507870 RepID=A0A1V8SHL9_9PEZI|nr:hypothetical protein B0A48_15846 [Cryoendolithus antarcticus]